MANYKGRITKGRITKSIRTNYRMVKITKCRKLSNGEIQNGESYRMAKDKTSKTTKRRNTKRRILQNGEIQNLESYRTAKDPERRKK